MSFSLHTLKQKISKFETAVVYTNNAQCIDYIHNTERDGCMEPTSGVEYQLNPLIAYVQSQVSELQTSGKRILLKQLPRKHNPAIHIAKICMRAERAQKWPDRTDIPCIDAMRGLRDCIRDVSERNKMSADGVRMERKTSQWNKIKRDGVRM